MRKDSKAAFRNSDLGRAKPKRHFLKTFVNDNLKQQKKRLHSDTGLVVDRTSPATVLRVILGLVVVHLLVIGGVMMRGSIAKSSSGLAISPTIVPPPAVEAQPVAQPAPVQPQAQPAQNEVHITQAPVVMENVTPVEPQPVVQAAPVEVQPAPAPATPAPATSDRKHLVSTGDTWGRIAAQYETTEDVLKAANPAMAALTNPPSGAYLEVPVAASTAAATAAPAQPAPAPQPGAAEPAAEVKYHIVRKGENLGRIAAKYKLPLKTLLEINGITMADAHRLKIGQKLRVSK